MKLNPATRMAKVKSMLTVCIVSLLFMAMNLRAADGTWTGTASGNWSDTSQWAGGIVADGSGSTAMFTNDITTDVTVTLDTARTNGNLVFADADTNSTAGWTLSGGPLTLAGTSPTITVSNLAPGKSVTVSAVLAGQGLTKNGDGLLVLSGANINLVGTNQINAGTLQFANASALGGNSNSLVMNGGAILFASGAPGLGITNLNVLTSAMIIVTGANYDNFMLNGGQVVGDANSVIYINDSAFRFTPGGTGNSSWDMFKRFFGTIDMTNSGSAAVARMNLGSTNIYDLSTVTLNTGTNAGRFQWRTTTSGTVVRIGALTGTGVASRLAASEQAGNPLLTWFIGYKNLSTTFAGIIQDTDSSRRGALVKVGTGSLTLYGANATFTGSATISNGVLALSNSVALTGTPSIRVVNPGVFDVSGLTNALGLPNGGWSLRALAGGPQVLAGDGSVSGQVVLTNGIVMPGSNVVATLTFNNDLTLGGTNNDLTLPLQGARVRFDLVSPAASDRIVVNGNLNLSGSNVIQIVPSAANVIVTNGTYVLFQWAGGLTGDLTNLFLDMPFQLGTAVLSTNASSQIVLTVSGAQLIDLTWRGDVSTNWDTSTANWRDNNDNPSVWTDGRVAHFDDTGAHLVNITTAVNPARLLLASTSDYTFGTTASGKITGSGVLVKDGSGKLILATGNDYLGSTTISNGIIQIGNGGTVGSIGSGLLFDYGNLAFNRADNITYSASASGTGGLIQMGPGTLTLNGSSSLTGDTVISNGATLFIGDGTINGSVLGTVVVNNNATNHYYFNNSGDVFVANSLVGTGQVIYEINNTGATKTPRNINIGTTATNTAFTGSVEVKPGVRLQVSTTYGLPGTNIICDFDSSTPLSSSVYVHGGAVTNTAAISIIGRGPATPIDTPYGFGGLRLNNAWAGTITIAGVDPSFANIAIPNAGVTTIGAGSGTGTILGNITDNGHGYELEYYGGTIRVGPTTGVNSYGATRITEQLNNPYVSIPTIVVALNTNAFSTNTLSMNGQTILQLNGNNLTFANLIDESAGFIGWIGAESNYPPVIQNASTTTPATITVGGDNGSQGFFGLFADGGTQPLGLTKVGTGTLTLSGDSTNTGPVTVQGGALALVPASGTFYDIPAFLSGSPFLGSGSFSNTTAFAVFNSGTLDVSGRTDGTLKLNSGQTLMGSGQTTGTINVTGNVNIGNGTLLLGINRAGLAHDSLAASGSMTYSGTLAVTNLGSTLQVGDVFQLFASGTAGFTAYNLQTNDFVNKVKYSWNNTVTSDGKITVASVGSLINTNTFPIHIDSISPTGITVSWPPDRLGFYLQSQTNSLGIGLSNNWVTMFSSSSVTQMTIPLVATNGSVYIRAVYTNQ